MNPRYRALERIRARQAIPPLAHSGRPSEWFGKNVFSRKEMKQYLSKEAYQSLKTCIEQRQTLDRQLSNTVANGVKAWALDQEVSHYTHWFQPLTGRTAEKHETFLELSEGEVIDKFSGAELSQQESDASSFPTGGLRRTFEARGYTAWDCSSPIFVFETTYGKTLCIPTIFVAYTGEALDFKIPLLKSIALLDQAATDVCHIFDSTVNRVYPMLGAEQEYFLVDESFYELRPDLLMAGRTLFGAASARGQQFDDHYFGSIPERVFAFMNELERDCHILGIPLKTRHNEVAPGQFECAPQFEPLNVAVDHGLMLMDLIDRAARKHHFRAILHERPFDGLNGSGKHNNWSLHTDKGINLLSPGKDPQENLMFLSFFVSVIKAVASHADLLRASIASAGNDLRLGANEAPPAIISVFVGEHLAKILKNIENPPRRKRNEALTELMHLGISEIPELLLDNTDRNRTSPFAFTGNKFEFRAVGASANSSSSLAILNVMVAQQLQKFRRRVESKMNRGRKRDLAVLDMIREYISESKHILFEGDGYSSTWQKEADRRGISFFQHTPSALDAYLSENAMQLYKESNLFSEAEIKARYRVLLLNYINQINIEANVLKEIAFTQILPVGIRYQTHLLENLQAAERAGFKAESSAASRAIAGQVGKRIHNIYRLGGKLDSELAEAQQQSDPRAKAFAFAEQVFPLFTEIRKEVDALEGLLPDKMWPLPKYREMLFIR